MIAKAGKPLVKVIPLNEPPRAPEPRPIGFMKGRIRVPDDFDRMGEKEIEALFGDFLMRLLLDTHVLLMRAAEDSPRLSAAARSLIPGRKRDDL